MHHRRISGSFGMNHIAVCSFVVLVEIGAMGIGAATVGCSSVVVVAFLGGGKWMGKLCCCGHSQGRRNIGSHLRDVLPAVGWVLLSGLSVSLTRQDGLSGAQHFS